MFDTISGLPLHPLVVHAVVVLLPLMAIVTVAVAVRRRWRSVAPYVVVANAVVVGLAFVAEQSGEMLQRRLRQFNPGVAQEHGEQGELVIYVALGLLAASVLVWLTSRSARLVPFAVAVAVLAGAGAIGWTYVTGESGARAVWEDTIANTTAP